MRKLLAAIPKPTTEFDEWNGVSLPPSYERIIPKQAPCWFVDGGNAEILGAPHYSLQLMHAVGIRYPDKQITKINATCLILKTKSGWEIKFEDGKNITCAGEREEAITKARHTLERDIAAQCTATGNNDLVCLDGDRAPDGCIALQKSSTSLTQNGFPLSSVLRNKGPWAAKLGEVFAVKLHERARHVFLVHKATLTDIKILSYYSADAVFPGYPAGLVLADRLARVSNEEITAKRVHARAMLRDLAHIDEASAATDSHSILDSMG